MTVSDTPSVGADPSDDELRLDLYKLLHDQIETERRWQFWRLAAGHLVVGVILAYAFLFDQIRFIALSPILYGIVVMDALKGGVRRLYLQQRLVELEAKLSDREPLFDWVTQYGFFGTGQRIEVWDVDLNTIPGTAQYALIFAIYAGLIAASLITWTPLDNGSPALGVGATQDLLLVGYGTFTVLFGTILAVGYLHYERVRQRIAQVAADADE